MRSARRKSMALKVNSKGVSVHIPATLSTDIAMAFVAQKTDWVLQQLQQQPAPPAPREWIDGDALFFLGEPYRLKLKQRDSAPCVTQSDVDLILSGRLNRLTPAGRRKVILDWYKVQATHYLIARTENLSRVVKRMPSNITIKTYKARWGSCNAKGEIQYNWKIIQAPISIIDYLIIHELCHLQHHNHSPAFWQCVRAALPEFKSAQQWLKQHGYKLEL